MPPAFDDLWRPLVAAIAVVLTSGLLGVTVGVPAVAEVAGGRAQAGADPAPIITPTGGPRAATDPTTPTTLVSPAPTAGPGGPADASSSTTAPLGPAAVPVAGSYRYRVEETTAAGATALTEETRIVEVLAGDRTTGVVQFIVQRADQRQVSILDWSPLGAVVRSTRLETATGTSRDCTWSPPFAEFGPLTTGAAWEVTSVCEAEVAGVPTTFELSGSGRVINEVTADVSGTPTPVWQIERNRRTRISATPGGVERTQVVAEFGYLLVDPARGLVVRSDLVTTVEDSQSTTRRVAILIVE